MQGRPGLSENLEQVTDGSIYLGLDAKVLGMVDAVMTTDCGKQMSLLEVVPKVRPLIGYSNGYEYGG